MKMNRKTILCCLLFCLCALPVRAQLETMTNGASFGTWRTNWINPAIVQINTNTAGIATNTAGIVAVSNAFVAADAALSNALGTAAFLDSGTNTGDLVLIESLSAWAVDTNDFATAAQGALADSALQAADGTAISNGVTSAYIAADTALSNALAGAVGGVAAAMAAVSPYNLVRAYTFDGALPEDWYGANTLSNPGGMSTAFDPVVGGFLDNPNDTDDAVTGGAMNVSNSFTIAFSALEGTDTNENHYAFYGRDEWNRGPYVYRLGSGERWTMYYTDGNEGGSVHYYAGSEGTTNQWKHFCMVFDHAASNMICYANAEEIGQEGGYGLDYAHEGTLVLGSNSAGDNDDVDIGYFYLWERALSSNEVVRLQTLEAAGQYGVQGLRRP